MSSRRIPDGDRYRKETDEIRILLIDGTERELTTSKWEVKFGVHPDLARQSRKHMPVDLYTDLAELYCSNPKT
jgi:hypothetical protein